MQSPPRPPGAMPNAPDGFVLGTAMDPALIPPSPQPVRTTQTTYTAPQPTALEQNVSVITPRDRVRWGPIVAGLLCALATFAILSLLGAAIGATALDANGGTPPGGDPNRYSGTAGLWGAASALIAFFLGGFVAAKTAAVGGAGNGWINGVMVFLAGLVLISYLASQGAGNLFGALGTNLGDLRTLGGNTVNDPNARAAAVTNARNGLWWSLASVLAGLVASGLGGLVGHRGEREVWHNGAEARG